MRASRAHPGASWAQSFLTRLLKGGAMPEAWRAPSAFCAKKLAEILCFLLKNGFYASVDFFASIFCPRGSGTGRDVLSLPAPAGRRSARAGCAKAPSRRAARRRGGDAVRPSSTAQARTPDKSCVWRREQLLRQRRGLQGRGFCPRHRSAWERLAALPSAAGIASGSRSASPS